MALPRASLVLRLNEIWHDLEQGAYDDKHPDILEDEIPRWRRAAADLLGGDRGPMAILDVGSGTGFVPLQLRDWLRPGDSMFCSDLSAGMLETCRKALEAARFPARLGLLKLDGARLALPDAAVDAVTVNAVLHHVPDPAGLCREIDRVLKPGGRVIIGHEPNRAYYEAPALLRWYWLLLPFADFKLFGYELMLRGGLFEPLRRPLARWIPELRRHNALLDAVNARLLAEGAIDSPLPAARLSSLLDVNSPTAGGTHAGRGFARADFAAWLPGYGLLAFETYKHLGKLQPRSGWARRWEERLARRYPGSGTSLSATLRKPA
jgi:SAM-dependent methyltransferase